MARSLTFALMNCAVCAVSVAAVYYKLIPQPWDIGAIGVASLLCPIAGFWLGVSVAAREIRDGSKRTQPIIAIVLSVAVFAYGFLVLTLHG